MVQTASIAGSPFVRSASHPVLSIENTSVGSGRGAFGPDEAGHELLVRVTPDDGEPQLAVVDSPFPRTYVPVFGDGFD